MKLHLLGKDIFEIQADICVSTVHHSKNLQTGILSKLILKGGGQKVQEDLDAMTSQSQHLSKGDVIVTEPGNLQNTFRHIFFACLSPWNSRNAEEIKEIVLMCCLLASGNNLTTIVFPCLGTGGLGYPEEKSAQAMMEGLASFAFDNPLTSLETIYISLHKKSPHCMMQWDGVFKEMVPEYNELISGLRKPIKYFAVTGSGGSERPTPKQHGASASMHKDRPRYRPVSKAPSKRSSKPPADTSTALTGWWSLPTIFSASATVGGAQMSATPVVSGRVLDDGAEVDLSLRLKVAVPWLKTLLSRFL